nr:transposase [Rhizobium tibeticum]
MQTQCSAKSFEFARVESRSVVAAFDGGAVTSDAAALLLGSTDRAIGLVDCFAACFVDRRRPELIEQEVRTLVSQRVFGISHGDEPAGHLPAIQSRPAGLGGLLWEVLPVGDVSGLQARQPDVDRLGDAEVSTAQKA